MPTAPELDAARPRPKMVAPWLALALISVLVLCAAAVRLGELPRAFTQVDDIGVASTILEARREVRTAQNLRTIINNPRLRQYGSLKFNLLRKADSAGLLSPAFGAVAAARDVLAVPARWTYAPAQYAITALLLSDGAPYRQTLIAGRAPSAVFSIAAIVLVTWASWRLSAVGETSPPLVATALMAVSLELLVYSTHMSNYALGVLASAALLPICAIDAGRWRTAYPAIALGVGAWCLVLASYQVLPLITAAFAAIGLSHLIRHHPTGSSPTAAVVGALRSTWMRRLILSAAVFALLMAPTYLLLLSSARPITWNAGPHNEFVFPGGRAGLGAASSFIINNSWLTFSAMTTPVRWDHPLRAPFTGGFAVLFLLGAARLLADRGKPRRLASGLFIVLSVTVTLAMSVAGLTALSPTRHALVLLPVFAVAIAEGAGLVLRRLVPRPDWRLPIAAAAVCGLLVVWAQALPEELARRRDPFDEAGLAARIAAERPAAVLTYGFTYAPDLMPAVRAEVPLFNRENLNFPWFAGQLPKADGPTLVISSSGPLTNADRRQLALSVAQSIPSATPWRWCAQAKVLRTDERAPQSDVEVYPIATGGVNGYFVYLTAPCAGGA